MSAADAEIDPSVCYRHPDRSSWTLCTRCGRTICPECQILTPSGVQCPDCVRETGGSVRWEPAQSRPPKKVTAQKRVRAERDRPRWMQVVGQMLRPGGATPVLTWGAIGLTLIVWIAGFPLNNLPFFAFAAGSGPSIEVWRFVTSAFVYPSTTAAILTLLLNLVFFLLIAPATERQFGRAKFTLLFFAGTAVGSAAMVLAGGVGFGLAGALWALLGAYLVAIWSIPQARTQFLIVLGINALLSLLFGGFGLPALIGGLLAGVGASLVLLRFGDRPRSRPSTPYLLVAAGVAVIVAIAVLRTAAFG